MQIFFGWPSFSYSTDSFYLISNQLSLKKLENERIIIKYYSFKS